LLPCCARLAQATWYSGSGILFVYRTLAGWQSDQAAWRLRADNGIRWEEFDVGELRQLDPNLSGEYRKGVLVRENGHTLNPHRLVNSLASAFQRDGGRLMARRVVGFDVVDGRLQAVRCEDQSLAADAAVVAAGIWSKPLGRAAWRSAAARDRARLPYHHDPRSGGHTAPSRCRRRRQIRCQPPWSSGCGSRGGLGRAAQLAACACAAHAGAPNASRARRHLRRKPPQHLDGPSSEPARFATSDRRLAQMQGMLSMPLGTVISAWPQRPRPPGRLPSSFPANCPRFDVAAFSPRRFG
jgi:hypothetical protein